MPDDLGVTDGVGDEFADDEGDVGTVALPVAAGIGLAVITAGIASGAAAAATEVIIELGATMGVAVSTTVAEIAAGTLIAAAFGGVESVTVDAAVAQPLKMITGLQKGFSLDEVNKAATDGMLYGGALGAGSGVLKAGMEGAFSSTTPLMLRPPSLRPDLVELGPAARKAEGTPCVGEPIDVATGAMLMTQTDLSLPASLPSSSSARTCRRTAGESASARPGYPHSTSACRSTARASCSPRRTERGSSIRSRSRACRPSPSRARAGRWSGTASRTAS